LIVLNALYPSKSPKGKKTEKEKSFSFLPHSWMSFPLKITHKIQNSMWYRELTHAWRESIGKYKQGLIPGTLNGLSGGHTPSQVFCDYKNYWGIQYVYAIHGSNWAKVALKVFGSPVSLAEFGLVCLRL
jgi:hypothetical protein